jgi:predicted DNA-binding transcriptional regulator AlpA
MSRRKTYKIPLCETPIFDTVSLELLQHPDAADFDMTTAQIVVKGKIQPKIRNIDKTINNITLYLTNNPNSYEVINSEPLVSKKQIAKMLKISRPTLDKWIKDGFITPIESKNFRDTITFPPVLNLQLHDKV